MTIAIYWFRNDLRIGDNAALIEASKGVDYLLPIYVHDQNLDGKTSWGFERIGRHRKVFLQESLNDLKTQIRRLGSDLFELSGNLQEIFLGLRDEFGVNLIYCEQIEAPEELGQVKILQEMGFEVRAVWQSSMLSPTNLPFQVNDMPDIFTQFRQQIEKSKLSFEVPKADLQFMPSLPNDESVSCLRREAEALLSNSIFVGGEYAARVHIDRYFDRRLVDTYKQTRNQLVGMDYSSKFSPWLAWGCCSARKIANKIADYEKIYGVNDGTYWLWFELLWRDYFRFLHFKYGKRLYHSSGLSNQKSNPFDSIRFSQWVSGNTGVSLVDAGMRELSATGFLSNRMRQIVASFWIYDMQGDWRAGAAWFESQLIDYDVYSNQGNWLYIAGKGTDPRGGRPFNVIKQAKEYDPDSEYRKMWISNT